MSWNNNVSLSGYLANDVELKKTENGKSVASFSIGVQRQTSEGGADFIKCVSWNKNAEYLSNYGKKGCLTTLSGELQVRTYKGKDGEQKTVYEILVNSVHVSKKENQTNTYTSSEEEYEEI